MVIYLHLWNPSEFLRREKFTLVPPEKLPHLAFSRCKPRAIPRLSLLCLIVEVPSVQTGPQFKGVKMIPAGLHFAHYGTGEGEKQVSLTFKRRDARELLSAELNVPEGRQFCCVAPAE